MAEADSSTSALHCRLGRKALFLEGGIQMFICFVVVAAVMGASFNKTTGNIPSGPAGAILAFECLFTAGFAWSWGPLGWLVPSEFHNIETRSLGQVRQWYWPVLLPSVLGLLHCCRACCCCKACCSSGFAASPAWWCMLLPAQLGSHVADAGHHSHPFPPLSLQAITTCVNFIFSFVIGQVYLTMLCKLEFGTYIFFAFWVLVMTLYAMFFLPETKGVPIEEMGFAWRWVSSPYTAGARSLAGPSLFVHCVLICQSSSNHPHLCALPQRCDPSVPSAHSGEGTSRQHFHVTTCGPACCISIP